MYLCICSPAVLRPVCKHSLLHRASGYQGAYICIHVVARKHETIRLPDPGVCSWTTSMQSCTSLARRSCGCSEAGNLFVITMALRVNGRDTWNPAQLRMRCDHVPVGFLPAPRRRGCCYRTRRNLPSVHHESAPAGYAALLIACLAHRPLIMHDHGVDKSAKIPRVFPSSCA